MNQGGRKSLAVNRTTAALAAVFFPQQPDEIIIHAKSGDWTAAAVIAMTIRAAPHEKAAMVGYIVLWTAMQRQGRRYNWQSARISRRPSFPKYGTSRSKPYQGLELFLNSPHQNFRPARKRTNGFIATAANTTFDSLKRRYEQYVVLARESSRAGDEIEAENFLQHAEHYYRTAVLLKAGHQQ